MFIVWLNMKINIEIVELTGGEPDNITESLIGKGIDKKVLCA